MMKTFDEYIQGRIFNLFIQVMPEGFEGGFYDLAKERDELTVAQWQTTLMAWGIGKQRAKDYAHYIVAYLEEQQLREQDDAQVKSYLTDEDAEKLKGLAGDIRVTYCNWQITPLDITAKTIKDAWYNRYLEANADYNNFINSLKGE